MEKRDLILDAYSRFVVAIQNKIIEEKGSFVMTNELFLRLLEGN